jgi:hypothetical protein
MTNCAGREVALVDSVSYLSSEDTDGYVVSASHGGVSAGEHALQFHPTMIAFNDAGGGKEDAGFRALDMLDTEGIAAVCVAHTSARIGDAEDHWNNGVVSRANSGAERAGIRAGMKLTAAVYAAITGSQNALTTPHFEHS